jgi:hypothetical protein
MQLQLHLENTAFFVFPTTYVIQTWLSHGPSSGNCSCAGNEDGSGGTSHSVPQSDLALLRRILVMTISYDRLNGKCFLLALWLRCRYTHCIACLLAL